MKRIICMVLLNIMFMTGCSKPESELVMKFVGSWRSETSDYVVTFLSNNTGYASNDQKKGPLFKWTASPDGSFTVIDEFQKPHTVRFVGDKLAIGGSHDYLIKAAASGK